MFRSSVAACFVLVAGAALAEPPQPSDPAKLTFGERTENPDGSVAMTVGRRLPTEWETRFGADFNIARPSSVVPAENLLTRQAPEQSTGAIWSSITMPGVAPPGFDKTSIDARVDPTRDEGKVGAVLSRSVPIDGSVSVTLQNRYSVMQTLPSANPGLASAPQALPMAIAAPTVDAAANPSAIWAADQSLRFDIAPSGTSVSASNGMTTSDAQWHQRLSVEQKLIGPLRVTGSIERAGSDVSNKSIAAGLKHTW